MAKLQTIYGQKIPSPKPTLMLAWLIFFYLGLPVLVLAIGLDLLMWWIGREVFDTCLALWCAF